MAAPPSSPQLSLPVVPDDDLIWTEYLKLASVTDARLVRDWTKVIDVLLIFVALFSGILTAFIIRTSDNFPQPAEVTNKILIAIYIHLTNASMQIGDLERLLAVDDTSKRINDDQNWLLYVSLTISILLAALAMAAKLWIVRYSREVTTSGTPRARARRRQEAFDGMLAWKLEYCIDAMPIMSLIAVVLFGLFLQSSTMTRPGTISYFVGVVFETGIAFIVIASSSAAFIFDSPYRSPFSDFISFILRIDAIPALRVRRRRTVCIFFAVCGLTAAAFLVHWQKHYPFYLPCIMIYFANISVFSLLRKGEEQDMQLRLFNLPVWILLSSIINFTNLVIATHFVDGPSIAWVTSFVLTPIFLGFETYVSIQMTKERPMTVEAEAVSWFLKTSSSVEPAWFQKAAQIAGNSPNVRALLVDRLLPLLSPLITSTHEGGQGSVTPEQKEYIKTLAILMDFKPLGGSFLHNRASRKRPTLPEELIERLEKLRCSHGDDYNHGGTAGCPEGCVGNEVKRILAPDEEGLGSEQNGSV